MINKAASKNILKQKLTFLIQPYTPKNLVNRLIENDWQNILFDLLVIGIITLYSTVLWWPTRYLPFHWGGADIATSAFDLLSRGFTPFLQEILSSSQPPLFAATIGLIWQIFDTSRIGPHIFMLPWLPVLMTSTYYLGKKWEGRLVGVVSSFLIGMMPLVVSEYGMLSSSLALAALTTTTLALFVYKKHILSMFFLLLAVWTHTIAILIIPGLLWWLWRQKQLEKTRILIVPIVGLVVWVTYHLLSAGWLFIPNDRPLPTPHSLQQFFQYQLYVYQVFFTSHLRWILLLSGILGWSWQIIQKKIKQQEITIIIGISLIFIPTLVTLALLGDYREPLSLMLQPLAVIVSVMAIQSVIKTFAYNQFEWGLITISLVLGLGWLSQWQRPTSVSSSYQFRQHSDLSYQDMILVGRQAAAFVETNYPHAKIYGGYPESYQLTQPYQGYVTDSLNFNWCSNYQSSTNQDILLYLHPYHSTQQVCRQLFDQLELQPIQRYQSNGVWIELYSNNATPSAATVR